MAIRKIARMGNPILRKTARHLSPSEIQSPAIRSLLADMIETMNDYEGIGLAAPQVYESIAMAIIDYQETDDHPDNSASPSMPFTVVFNPVITVLDSTEQSFWEGCLSVPEIRGLVDRPRKIQVDYLGLDAKKKSVVVEGFLATVFQHEIDHLNGVLFVDRIKLEPGKNRISFIPEYLRYLAPGEDDEIGELAD